MQHRRCEQHKLNLSPKSFWPIYVSSLTCLSFQAPTVPNKQTTNTNFDNLTIFLSVSLVGCFANLAYKMVI